MRQREQAYDGWQHRFMKIDLFAQPFRLLLPDREDKYRSILGAVFSLGTLIILIGYALYKIQELTVNLDYSIQIHEKKLFYDPADELTFENDGFMIAAAITDYDGSAEDITDPEIGEVKFYRKTFN